MNVSGINTLQANEFAVTLEGETLDTVLSFDTFEYMTPGGEGDKPLLTLYKLVEDDRDTIFNRWLAESLGSTDSSGRPRRTFVLTAVNDGHAIRRWTFQGAWIAAVALSSLDSASYEFAVERVRLGYDRIDCELLP